MRLGFASAALVAAALCSSSVAEAFCGFYVAGSNKPMFNDATQVVLMRSGTRTVLSMQNNYRGPTEAFALVIPVPEVLQEASVKTLPKEVFTLVDQLGSPRLVEYWERDPCMPDDVGYDDAEESGGTGTAMALEEGKMGNKRDLGVKVEAQFAVGEYQIQILSAKDATGLDTWLRQENYSIPKGAEPLLRPYVESGMKFFVAKVDATKVKFVDGRADLSPLRFHYDSEQFALPIRLGLANSSGTQDLIVNIIAESRYEVANYPNVAIPTNIQVKRAVRARFGEFYVALFDATMEKNKGAVVTEYSWDAGSCDPCPGPTLDPASIATLGGDVIDGSSFYTLTRLHARYDRTIKDDLQFAKAGPITGGREEYANGQLMTGWEEGTTNAFQARYIIRHPWEGPITCSNPVRGVWGAKDGSDPDFQAASRGGKASDGVKAGTKLAFAPRTLELATALMTKVKELDLDPVMGAIRARPQPAATAKKSGCGCGAAGDGAGGGLLVLALFGRRRRRR